VAFLLFVYVVFFIQQLLLASFCWLRHHKQFDGDSVSEVILQALVDTPMTQPSFHDISAGVNRNEKGQAPS
jgi:hypothetical protein